MTEDSKPSAAFAVKNCLIAAIDLRARVRREYLALRLGRRQGTQDPIDLG